MKKLYFLILTTFVMGNVIAQQNAIQLHRAIPDGRVDSVWQGLSMNHAYTGKNVIIGITDWGFDYTHPMYYDTSMREYRVLRAWDQWKTNGPAPQGYDYGAEYIGKEELLNAQCDTSNVYQYNYHGGHVAGIAAGGGAGTQYRGVAFESDLLFASILVSEQAVRDAWLWMYKVAQQEQKRLVINMSLGLYYFGNMDGTGSLSRTADSLARLGVIFVSSGGNNGDVSFHIKHNFTENQDTLRTQINYASGSSVQYGQSISMLSSPLNHFVFCLKISNNSNQILTETPFYCTANGFRNVDTFLLVNEQDTVFYQSSIEAENPYNQRPQARLIVKKLPSAAYKANLFVIADSGEFHAWNVIELTNGVGNWGGTFSKPNNLSGWSAGDTRYGVGAPGNFDACITVAAHHAAYTTSTGYLLGGEMAVFSSNGPLTDERQKPDLSAPGYNVISSISSFNNTYTGTTTNNVVFNGRTYPFAALSGTSMSSPFVSGVVALMLQANPELSAAQVKEILQSTAYQDKYTGKAGVERCGFGKVNAYHAILKSLEYLGVQEAPSSETRYTIYPNPTDGITYLSLQSESNNINCEIFDLTGRSVEKYILHSGVNILYLQNLKSGCYIARIADGKTIHTKKIIIQ